MVELSDRRPVGFWNPYRSGQLCNYYRQQKNKLPASGAVRKRINARHLPGGYQQRVQPYRAIKGKKRPVRVGASESLPLVSLSETWVKVGVATPSTVTVTNTPSLKVGSGRLAP